MWPVARAPQPFAPARPGVLATHGGQPDHRPTIRDLAAAARDIGAETTFEGAARRIETEALRLTGCAEAMCVAFDWARRQARSPRGPITTPQVIELVADVAGRGRRQIIGCALLEPIGVAPAMAVLALRRRAGVFTPTDLGSIAALAGGVAQTLQRLLTARP